MQGIAISSYQGGHVEYFKYMVDLLKRRGGEDILVFGGGGGVIVPSEIEELQHHGVARIYSPEDGQRMGLAGMIGEMLMRADRDLSARAPKVIEAIQGHGEPHWRALAQLITALESGRAGGEPAFQPERDRDAGPVERRCDRRAGAAVTDDGAGAEAVGLHVYLDLRRDLIAGKGNMWLTRSAKKQKGMIEMFG